MKNPLLQSLCCHSICFWYFIKKKNFLIYLWCKCDVVAVEIVVECTKWCNIQDFQISHTEKQKISKLTRMAKGTSRNNNCPTTRTINWATVKQTIQREIEKEGQILALDYVCISAQK